MGKRKRNSLTLLTCEQIAISAGSLESHIRALRSRSCSWDQLDLKNWTKGCLVSSDMQTRGSTTMVPLGLREKMQYPRKDTDLTLYALELASRLDTVIPHDSGSTGS